ncbi:lipase family protein [Nocardioides sp.]|uniref:lipase family protein n=1 Tax=Nocardioides sp. TaxID=35761 RepID=UPI003783570F
MSAQPATRSAAVPPSADPFYGPVSRVPDPGIVIRSRRVSVVHETVARAWQLVYSSTGSRGQSIAVSGTILAPTAAWRGPGRRPTLTYGVGVHGLGRDAAPSFQLTSGTEVEIEVIAQALRQGWMVLVTDGEGLGMPGPHTYGAGLPGGHTMLDIVRAASSVVPSTAGAPVLVWGYSEGGRCAAMAAELHPDYAPDLDLVAVAAGGVPSDLAVMAAALEDGPFAGLNLAVLVGLAHAHGDPALLNVLTEEGREAATRAAELDAAGLIVEYPQPLRAHTVRDTPWEDPVWRELLAQERAGQRPPRVPTLVYHVEDDQLVPTELGRQLAEDYRRLGASVDWYSVDADNHLSGVYVSSSQVVAWLADALREESVVGRCAPADRHPEGDSPSPAG